MYPTLSLSGDYLLSLRSPLLRLFSSRGRSGSSASSTSPPNLYRGDLIDFISPRDPSYSVCKRIIGLPGDVVCVDPSGLKGRKEDWVKVPQGYLWVTGDNLSNSNDSRDYGPVPVQLVRGKIVARIWPNARWLTAEKDPAAVVHAQAQG